MTRPEGYEMSTPNIPKVLRRLASLKRLAVDQAGTPEGENAERMMDQMSKAHPIKLVDGALDLHSEELPKEHDWEKDLLVLISRVTHVEVHILKSGDFRVQGLRVAVEETVKHYKTHRKKMERLMGFAGLGYIFGAFPEEAVESYVRDLDKASQTIRAGVEHAEEQQAKEEPEEPSASEKKVVTAASDVGESARAEFWERLAIE